MSADSQTSQPARQDRERERDPDRPGQPAAQPAINIVGFRAAAGSATSTMKRPCRLQAPSRRYARRGQDERIDHACIDPSGPTREAKRSLRSVGVDR